MNQRTAKMLARHLHRQNPKVASKHVQKNQMFNPYKREQRRLRSHWASLDRRDKTVLREKIVSSFGQSV